MPLKTSGFASLSPLHTECIAACTASPLLEVRQFLIARMEMGRSFNLHRLGYALAQHGSAPMSFRVAQASCDCRPSAALDVGSLSVGWEFVFHKLNRPSGSQMTCGVQPALTGTHRVVAAIVGCPTDEKWLFLQGFPGSEGFVCSFNHGTWFGIRVIIRR